MPKVCAVGLWLCATVLAVDYMMAPTTGTLIWTVVGVGLGGFLWTASD